MQEHSPTRRHFLQGTGALAGGAWLAATLPAIRTAAQAAEKAASGKLFTTLTADEARTLAAIAAQIIPTDERPGAAEANVIYFMDAAFGSFMQTPLGMVRAQLPAFEAGARKAAGDGRDFVTMDEARQIAYLTERENTPLFGFLTFLVTLGMFAMPSYGGNRDHIGWDLIGFKHQHVWLPPFGHYDARHAETQT